MFLLASATGCGAPDLVVSASDLVTASVCEYSVLRILDARLGRGPDVPRDQDPMLARSASLGDAHELRVLNEFRERYGQWNPVTGRGVYEVLPARSMDRTELQAKHRETLTALARGADVVFQGSFFDGRFHGRADFLVRTSGLARTSGGEPGTETGGLAGREAAGTDRAGGPDSGPDGDGPDGVAYAVYDTKLARHTKTSALLQLAAYGQQLLQAGVAVAPEVHLILGNHERTTHPLSDLLPVYRERRQRLLEILAAHRGQCRPVEWNDPRYTACGRCPACTEQVAATRDLLLVGGMSLSRRSKLLAAGITTIDQLAALALPADNGGTGPAAGRAPADRTPADRTGTGRAGTDHTLLRLRDQARMQTGTTTPDGEVRYTDGTGQSRRVAYQLLENHTISALPAPSPGDIFFDFEGDPLWQDPATGSWGLEYLFGVVENAPAQDATAEPGVRENPAADGQGLPYKPFWAHGRAAEGQALADFLCYVAQRRRQYPDLHIYHYANYEKSALRRLSVQHETGREAVERLLQEGVLVDLYDVVRSSLRISERSYSIKKLEPLYMGSHLRGGDVTDAAASVVAYAHYCAARDAGHEVQAQQILDGIADYNEYDCLSTRALRNWLLKLMDGTGPQQGPPG